MTIDQAITNPIDQAITNPIGVTTFGSAIIRVKPDVAALHFDVRSGINKHPSEAFREARENAKRVRAYLAGAGLSEFGSSRVNLSPVWDYKGKQDKFRGFSATITFGLKLRDLDRLDEVLSGVVDAGVNIIESVDFQTSRLKELRAEARKKAIRAAREKAGIYCAEAGVEVGKVVHIEDANPDQLRGREGHRSGENFETAQAHTGDDEEPGALEPGQIMVGAAVIVAFKLKD